MNHIEIQQILAKLLKSLILDGFPTYYLSPITYYFLLSFLPSLKKYVLF